MSSFPSYSKITSLYYSPDFLLPSSTHLSIRLSPYGIILILYRSMSLSSPSHSTRRASLHEQRISSIERALLETDVRIRHTEETLQGMQILHSLRHRPIRLPTTLLRHFQHLQNENLRNAKAAHDALPALPPTAVPTVPVPTAATNMHVRERMRTHRSKLQAQYRVLYYHRVVDRAMWKARLSTARSPSKRKRRKVDVSKGKQFKALFRNADRDVDTGAVNLATLAVAAQSWERKASPRHNAAHVPEWDHRVAVQQPRIPAVSVLVPDAREAWYRACSVNPWTTNERLCFLRLFIQYGKHFDRIAEGLSFKSRQDVARFYYRYKLPFGLKALVRRVSERKDAVPDCELQMIAHMPDLAIHIQEDEPRGTPPPFGISPVTSSTKDDTISPLRHLSSHLKPLTWKGTEMIRQETVQSPSRTQGCDFTQNTKALGARKGLSQSGKYERNLRLDAV